MSTFCRPVSDTDSTVEPSTSPSDTTNRCASPDPRTSSVAATLSESALAERSTALLPGPAAGPPPSGTPLRTDCAMVCGESALDSASDGITGSLVGTSGGVQPGNRAMPQRYGSP